MKRILIILLLWPVLAQSQTNRKHPKKVVHKHNVRRMQSRAVSRSQPGSDVYVTGPAPSVVAPSVTATDVFKTVDVMPSFAGGVDAWRGFLQHNLDANEVSHDEESMEKYGSRQSVRVQFVVCEDGSLCNFSIVNTQNVSEAAAREAIRVMKKSPNWKPGKLNGRNVKVYFIQPIVFQFAD